MDNKTKINLIKIFTVIGLTALIGMAPGSFIYAWLLPENIFYTVLLSDTIYTIQDGESRPIYLYEGGLKHINYEALQQETPYQSIFEAEMKLIKKGYSGGLLQLFQLKDHLYFEICQGEEC